MAQELWSATACCRLLPQNHCESKRPGEPDAHSKRGFFAK